MKTTLELYCQFLTHTPVNYTATYLADHTAKLSHDSVYRYLKTAHLRPRLLWQRVKDLVAWSDKGYILFDDTVLDKNYSNTIEGVRRQYSGNAKRVIKGIGVVNCVYVNEQTGAFWVIDYRMYDPQRDGKKKMDLLFDMLMSIERRGIAYRYMLMDTWYAHVSLMKYCMDKQKVFYCPIKTNRKVDETGGVQPYVQAHTLTWQPTDQQVGKWVKLHQMPGATKVKLFRVVVSTDRTELIVTNDPSASTTDEVRQTMAQRWKIEQFHREAKQLTGIEKCQCRLNRSQRNHLLAAMLAWVNLKNWAHKVQKTIYQVKDDLLDDYLTWRLKHPVIPFH